MWSILAVGFFNSIMFPTIFSLGEAELGPLSGSGSGILNMAIVGGAILPVIQGVGNAVPFPSRSRFSILASAPKEAALGQSSILFRRTTIRPKRPSPCCRRWLRSVRNNALVGASSAD